MGAKTRFTTWISFSLGASAAACGGTNVGSGAPPAESACAGIPVACGLLTAAQCASATGCAPGACSGTAASCDGFTTSTACLLQGGCTPNGSGGACSGIALSCLAFSTDSECRAQEGCSWQEGCSGRAAACASLSQTACLAQPGCHIELASSADAGATAETGSAEATPSRNCDDAGVPPALLIDDMEDRTQSILGSDAYGSWYVYDDETTGAHMMPAQNTVFEMEPIPGGRCASEYAMRLSGTGFSLWGAGMGFDFGYGGTNANGMVVKIPIDARAYAGVRFWARVGQATTTRAAFSILAGTCPPADAGDDASAPKAPSDCAQSFGKNLVLTTDWVRYDIGLDELSSNPARSAIPRDQVYSFEFVVPANATFDLWIDDISWLPAEPTP
jgi:hypothetical protein